MKTVKEKLGIKEGKQVLVLNPPEGYLEVQGCASVEEADIIQLFISSKDDLQHFLDQKRSSLKKSIALWITYPKASPHLGINRDIIANFLKKYELEGIAICSIDETWSALRFKSIS
ncbi:MAG: hypothetical protein JSR39_01780 [Verrucomicrobia bacterium]|nr:hypothetical protein [Verrucomicrobiota bacterium]